LSSSLLSDFALTILPTHGDKPIGKDAVLICAKFPVQLFKIYGIKYDAFLDITDMVTNRDKFIEKIENYAPWKNHGTKSRILGRILKLSKIWKPMAVAIPPNQNLYNFLDAIYRRWKYG